MSDPIIPPVPDTDRDPNKVSPKVIVATIVALLVPGVIAAISYVNENQAVLGINNPILGVALAAVVPGVLTFLASYGKKDPARNG